MRPDVAGGVDDLTKTDGSNQLPLCADDGEGADVMIDQARSGEPDVVPHTDGDDVAGHDVSTSNDAT